MLKKVMSAFALCLCILFSACADQGASHDASSTQKPDATDNNNSNNSVQSKVPAPDNERQPIGTHHAEITIKDHGVIKVELDGDSAPITVQNFIDLAKSGFYDGLTIHRVDNGFMMQGGDPKGDGTGGSENTIVGEFAINNIENNLSHTRGAISMARSSVSNDSASSQFFIVHQDSTFLDGQYACFGYVTEGMEVVDEICENTPVIDEESCMVEKQYQPVIETIKITD